MAVRGDFEGLHALTRRVVDADPAIRSIALHARDGRRVLVTTKQGIKKTTGLATVYVNAFAASGADQPPPAPTSKPPAARSQDAKAHREFTANSSAPDDIPF